MAASAPKTLVLIPGLILTRDLWTDILPELGPEWAVLHPTAQWEHDNLGDIARALLAQAPPRFSLAGLSMGGYVAFEILRQAPERVERVAFVNTTARPDSPEKQQNRRDLIRLAERGRFKGVTPALLPSFLHPRNLTNDALVNRIYAMAAVVGRDGFVRQQTAILNRPDSRPDLARIACPALVIGGAGDQLTPPDHAEEIAAGLPDGRLHILDCGHLAPMEAPGETARLMRDWLNREPQEDRKPTSRPPHAGGKAGP